MDGVRVVAPELGSALPLGEGLGVTLADGLAEELGRALPLGVGLGVGLGLMLSEGLGVGLGLMLSEGLGVGLGLMLSEGLGVGLAEGGGDVYAVALRSGTLMPRPTTATTASGTRDM